MLDTSRARWCIGLGLAALAGCASAEKTAAPAAESKSLEAKVSTEDESELDRSKSLDLADEKRSPSGLQDLVSGNSAFAFDLHRTLDSGNVVYSPHSISVALAPVYEGASADTRSEIATALHYRSVDEGQLPSKFRKLADELRKRELRDEENQRGFRLKISNAIWAAEGLAFVPTFQRLAETEYLMEPRRIDFSDSARARDTINAFVEESTAGKIKDLLPGGAVTNLTRVVVTNAVYFNAAWLKPFPKASTQDGVFLAESPNGKLKVPFMSQTNRFGYFENDDFQLLEMPYVGDQVAAYVVLPRAEFASVDASLSPKKFEWMRDQLTHQRVDVKLPKFKLRSKLDLKAKLGAMGVKAAFDESTADFSKMLMGSERVYVTDIVHQAFVNVDEAGTEAAAATSALMGTRSKRMPPVEFHATRPFTFLIVDKPTGSLLFVARVTNPPI